MCSVERTESIHVVQNGIIGNLVLPIIAVERNAMDSNIPSRIQLGNFPQHHGCAVVLFEEKKQNKTTIQGIPKRKYILK